MLYRRFFLVASLIALAGASIANLIQHTRTPRTIVVEYPSSLQLGSCRGDLRCGVVIVPSTFRA